VRIREAGVGEAPVVGALQLRTALRAYDGIFPSEAPVPTVKDHADHWRSAVEAGQAGFVAEIDDAIVGMALAGRDSLDPEWGHLARFYVAVEHQGRGVGTGLYATCLAHLRERGFTSATLWVLERNSRARSWYERLGWVVTGERKAVYAPAGIDDLRYRLQSI
jgi:ribosomal protein S18 acetylase RimI-like enzyme